MDHSYAERVVDLSYAAARELGTLASGVAYVKVEVVPKETEIPYATESKGIEVPEVEYGTAGVCYEFIPEWEKVEEDKPKEIERKVDTYLNRRQVVQQTDKGGNTEARRVNTAQSARQTSKTTNQATRQSQQSKPTTQQKQTNNTTI